jgi:Putative ATPase subunit of terminase (gpP-like)
MRREAFTLAWHRPKRSGGSGYEWAESRHGGRDEGGRLVLVPKPDAEEEVYWPLIGNPAFYQILAKTPPTPEGILGFANRYGRLGLTRLYQSTVDGRTGELLDLWQNVIRWLGNALGLWHMAHENDRRGLEEVIWWIDESTVVNVHRDDRKGWLEAVQGLGKDYRYEDIRRMAGVPEPYLSQIKPGEVIRPARLQLFNVINHSLRQGVVSPQLLWDPERDREELKDVPSSLLGAIYLQLAEAVFGKAPPRPCPVCGRWFDVSPKKNRADRVTCSRTCRTQAYRRRRYRARDLFAEGVSLKKIAKELGTDVETVEKWVTNMKGVSGGKSKKAPRPRRGRHLPAG